MIFNSNLIINIGDILQKGLNFYRVYSISYPDIIMNKILYNEKTEKLQIYHGYEFTTCDEIGNNKLYTLLNAKSNDTKLKVELIKRKYKLKKINNISNEKNQ